VAEEQSEESKVETSIPIQMEDKKSLIKQAVQDA
jgi:hypothetical protein